MRKIGEINDALLAQHFHWPSDGLQVWRHFCDYSLVRTLHYHEWDLTFKCFNTNQHVLLVDFTHRLIKRDELLRIC